jgi:hypothetical protein
MRKAATEEQLQGLAQNYHYLQDAWHADNNQMAGAWIGAAFENQNQHLEYKQTDWKTGQMYDRRADGSIDTERSKTFVSEIYEKRGSYPLAQMGSNTIEKLKEAHELAVSTGDVDTQNRVSAIAETFMHQVGTAGVAPTGTGDEIAPVLGPTGVPIPGQRQASTQGAAHVAERVRELATLTRVHTNPDDPAAPVAIPGGTHEPGYGAIDPNRREQG